MDTFLPSFIEKLVIQYQGDKCTLLNMLWDIQKHFDYVSEEAVAHLARNLNISQIDLQDTLTFYHFFHTRPAGKVKIYLDTSVTAVHQGQAQVQAAFEKELGIVLGEVSKDYDIGLYATPCIGLSDQGPACLINFLPFTQMTAKRAVFIARQLKKGISPQKLLGCLGRKSKKRLRQGQEVTNLIQRKDFLLNDRVAGAGLKKAMQKTPEDIINNIKISGLRGRGGAGFPTWKKWELCRNTESDTHYVICNADEGEPGTFKDRLLLTKHAPMLFEGMAITGRAIGAQEGIIYLRAEYQYLLPRLSRALTIFHKKYLFRIRIQIGAGAYVCGEETALLESLEGKRGEPRIRPPFPVESGYKGRPTVINNVETFCTVTRIMEKGPKKFCDKGTEQSSGTRLFSLSGDILKPGIYEWPFGITISQILTEVRARDALALQIGGPSGTLISAHEKERKICFEDLATGGAITVFSKKRDLLQIIQKHMEFFVNESCGCCSPCRAGNVMLLEFVQMLKDRKAHARNLKNVLQWCRIITQTSRCGLGQTSSNPILTALKSFPELFHNFLIPDPKDGVWNFDLKMATGKYDQIFEKNEHGI
ncbi:MAG: NAD(P)H-dependent oxidoreductase subunit E [Bdellovibrio sp.]|nr:NAD(P)H-dependent oxidoreductase subunit E [Bdellovibrio sp.]